ncbi:MAG: hypothetical protein ABIH17_05225, partial [Pseudomonadota bacterium]
MAKRFADLPLTPPGSSQPSRFAALPLSPPDAAPATGAESRFAALPMTPPTSVPVPTTAGPAEVTVPGRAAVRATSAPSPETLGQRGLLDANESVLQAPKRMGVTEWATRAMTGGTYGEDTDLVTGVLSWLSPVARWKQRVDAIAATARLANPARVAEMDDNDIAIAAYGRPLGPDLAFDRANAVRHMQTRDAETITKLKGFEQEVAQRAEADQGATILDKAGNLAVDGIIGAAEMVPYYMQMSAKWPGVAVESAVQFLERRAGDVDVVNGDVVVNDAGAGVIESAAKAVASAAGEYVIEQYVGKGVSKLGKKAAATAMGQRALGSKFARYATELTKRLKAKTQWSPAMKQVSKWFGFDNMFEEIVVEEGLQALYDATFNLNNSDKALGDRLAEAGSNWLKAVPEMLVSFGIFGLGRQGVSRYQLSQQRAYLKELGATEEQIADVFADEDPKSRARKVGRLVARSVINKGIPAARVSDSFSPQANFDRAMSGRTVADLSARLQQRQADRDAGLTPGLTAPPPVPRRTPPPLPTQPPVLPPGGATPPPIPAPGVQAGLDQPAVPPSPIPTTEKTPQDAPGLTGGVSTPAQAVDREPQAMPRAESRLPSNVALRRMTRPKSPEEAALELTRSDLVA